MKNKVKDIVNWTGVIIEIKEPFSLQDLVNNYLQTKYKHKYTDCLKTHAEGHICYLDSLHDTLDFICGETNYDRILPPYKVNSHQRYFRFPSRQKYIPEIIGRLKEIESSNYDNFEDLFHSVNALKLFGFGPTTVYDYSLRLGWHLNPKIEPKKFVYLHSKPGESARILKSKGYISKTFDNKILFEDLPDDIKNSDMTARDVEHFLCCYHKYIEKLPNNNNKNNK